uniref:F-box domain-containing protein n=1 Tax=Ditylenchus dipsaci TaxID=166011 RepID=A0A915CXA6_9BILA
MVLPAETFSDILRFLPLSDCRSTILVCTGFAKLTQEHVNTLSLVQAQASNILTNGRPTVQMIREAGNMSIEVRDAVIGGLSRQQISAIGMPAFMRLQNDVRLRVFSRIQELQRNRR